jgi:hypothetical protein
VAVVGGVTVPVVDVVGVALVRDGDMPALSAVLMVVSLMRCVLGGAAFVDMTLVNAVDVALVRVVGVIAVLKRDVAAVFAVDVRVIGVRGVLAGVRHDGSPFSRYGRRLHALRRGQFHGRGTGKRGYRYEDTLTYGNLCML